MPAWIRIFSPIVRKIVGKQTYVTIGFCNEHLKQGRFIRMIGWFLLLFGIGVFISPFYEPSFVTYIYPLISLGSFFFILGLFIGSLGTPVKAAYMDPYMVKIKGCCKDFLNSVAINNTE